MAACRPFSGTGSDLAASRKHVIAVVVFSVLYNIPRFFEYQKVGRDWMVMGQAPQDENRGGGDIEGSLAGVTRLVSLTSPKTKTDLHST